MGELTITTFLSLDGVLQAPGALQEDPSGGFPWGGWIFPFVNEESGKIIDENFSRADAFLLGRKTYDIFADYWPKVTDPKNLIAAKLNSLPKFVASRSRNDFAWMGSQRVKDVLAELPAMKARFPREIQVHGSGNLAQTLMKNDLIDEYRLFVFPVLLGKGKRLFNDGTVPAALKLERSVVTGKGVVYSVYRRAGPVQTGTIGE